MGGILLILVTVGEGVEGRGTRKLVRKKVRRKLLPSPRQCPEETKKVLLYEDPGSCNRFFKCVNGTMTLEECENGLLFDQSLAHDEAIHNFCVYMWKVDCGSRPRDTTPQPSRGCEYKFGLFPVASGCQRSYIKCELGVAQEIPCEAENENIPVPLGLAYDPVRHTCDWPDLLIDLGCDPQDRIIDFTCPLLGDLAGTTNEKFSPFPRFALEDSRIYVICVDSRPRLQSCGAHDLFDSSSLTCVRRRSRDALGLTQNHG